MATTTILSNLRADASLYSGTKIILPKTVTAIKTGAFAMSQSNGPIYFPTKLTNMEEGSLTTTKEAKFNQTRLSSITYAFAISNDKITSQSQTAKLLFAQIQTSLFHQFQAE